MKEADSHWAGWIFRAFRADIEGLHSLSLSEEGSGRGITLLTSPMSCTLPFAAFPVCVCVLGNVFFVEFVDSKVVFFSMSCHGKSMTTEFGVNSLCLRLQESICFQ